MLDELDDEQRARLCILTTLRDAFAVEADAFDLVRMARWVELGCDPDAHHEGSYRGGGPIAEDIAAGRVSIDTRGWVPAVG